ncbi:MoaD/ThiS family protein [Aquimarina muelleri]|uniref:Molybdopterin synthase sulfur carrier subunit n=1 Tax=Aquimarina muelleri TaxID=279356 RepID=A0A918N418_9FLAO|nr:MoaD/ThiS family protein [Aquimarina muelleri]MCX2762767.1 MoaD/ThiS family protein [Aquimarina muelleri]GGX18962.1 hypothetical protein GCM10007384_20370 [Aquimarina muelleri]
MQLTIKYFGLLAEVTATTEELLETETCSVFELVKTLKNQYPKLGDTNFKIAVDQQLIDLNYIIETNAEIALLPPFAGG